MPTGGPCSRRSRSPHALEEMPDYLVCRTSPRLQSHLAWQVINLSYPNFSARPFSCSDRVLCIITCYMFDTVRINVNSQRVTSRCHKSHSKLRVFPSPTVTGALCDIFLMSMLPACLHTSPRSLTRAAILRAHWQSTQSIHLRNALSTSATTRGVGHADASAHVPRPSGQNCFKRIKLAVRSGGYLSSPRYCSSIAHRMSASLATKSTSGKSQDEYRLPTNVKPTHYDVTIWTDLEELIFEGSVKIQYAM